MDEPEEREYEELFDVISGEEFDFDKWYEHEDTVLRPQLEAAGFYGIYFTMGEADSFGPLSRKVTCIDNTGMPRKFIYG